MNKYKISLILLFLLISLLVSSKHCLAQEQTLIETGIESSATTSASTSLVYAQITEAVDLLKSSAPIKYSASKNGSLIKRQISMAILDKSTGQIFEKRFWINESQIKTYYRTRKMTFTPDNASDGITANTLLWNSFNTTYYFNNPDLVVLANKYLLPQKSSTIKYGFKEIVYAPYSSYFDDPGLIQQGKDYLEKQVNDAFAELESKSVMSKITPNHLVIASTSKDFIKNIILIEHIDPTEFSRAKDGGETLSNRVLALLGANKENAYVHAVSPAGANGIAQFIKSTYNLMVRQYPSAELNPDYLKGMADHVNSVKAMVLFFDYHTDELNHKIKNKNVISELGITEEMLAAAYNGGPGRVVTSVNKYGLTWLANMSKTLRRETATYLKKFESIKSLSLF